MRRRSALRLVLPLAAAGVAIAAVAVAIAATRPGGEREVRVPQNQTCAYSRNRLSALRQFELKTGRSFDCVEVFNDAAADWRGWERPYFLNHPDRDFAWPDWVARKPDRRRLVVAQSLIPDDAPRDWRERGARGQYDAHARRLARNLVARGLGSSVIRLAHEPNGDWYRHTVGNRPAQQRAWRLYWRRTVRAMRSVDGSKFVFDWNINSGYRPIPFERYYPGDDVVDVIGVDFYDDGERIPRRAGAARWRAQWREKGGLRAAMIFARRHGKPVSIPEWGLLSRAGDGVGDNPDFVRRIAALSRRDGFAYHSYFDAPGMRGDVIGLAAAPRALAEYRRQFGGRR